MHRLVAPQFTPLLPQWRDAGVYQLWIRVNRPVVLRVGGLGRLHFAPGTYVYTGRAARGLRRRVLRHVRGAEHFHWHIDYLLASPAARVIRVNLAATDPAEECRVNRAAGCGALAPVQRFGASDCRSRCPAHLWLMMRGARAAAIDVALSGEKECK
ncbi:MAG TPA: DUF123 domain-containing protein [Phycisphaerae bacterium]|nr:DUF123 domain-containing protein [Phycisphaerae bacterium]HPC21388.1 DUF123 domain-containing protein [Phycisphaerae bacterium]HRS28229.1 DUF123 domain-containing protein [Phycisphaerae bacterium]